MLLEIPSFGEYGFRELKQKLTNCPVMKEGEKWNQLKFFLTSNDENNNNNLIANKLGDFKDANSNAIEIMRVYAGFPQEMDGLLERIKEIDGKTDDYKELHQTIYNIAENQQQKYNKSLLDFNEFESVLGINQNFIEPSFENNWNALCLILNNIDWQNIWSACENIKELAENDSKYLKSLCFTKNYNFLKRKIVTFYNPSEIILEFGKLLKPYSNEIDSWLETTSQELVVGKSNQNKNKLQHEDSSPILLIIIDRGGSGKNQDKWEVKAQLKCQNEEIIDLHLESKAIGTYRDEFQDIPQVIKQYIDKLEQESEFRDKGIGNLRIEIFLPLISLNTSLEEWLMKSNAQTSSENLITKYRIFLRSRERYKQNSRIDLLENGWRKLSDFIANDNTRKVTKAIIKEIIDETQKPNILEISEKDCIDNWIELQIALQECDCTWGVNWKSSLPSEFNERRVLFEFIFQSGIPIAFWHWYCVPKEVNLESKFEDCLSKNNLNNRCQKLLEKTWNMRRIPWGASDEKKRKTYPGYYLGMLLEDPEIIPDDVCY